MNEQEILRLIQTQDRAIAVRNYLNQNNEVDINIATNIRAYLAQNNLPDVSVAIQNWFQCLATLRVVQGNLSNDVSFVATLLAKTYLGGQHNVELNAAQNAQGANGLDIDIQDNDGNRIIAEIKTTVPYLENNFGAAQAAAIIADLNGLAETEAAYKYMFVTNADAFQYLQLPAYNQLLHGITLVNLVTGERFGQP